MFKNFNENVQEDDSDDPILVSDVTPVNQVNDDRYSWGSSSKIWKKNFSGDDWIFGLGRYPGLERQTGDLHFAK